MMSKRFFSSRKEWLSLVLALLVPVYLEVVLHLCIYQQVNERIIFPILFGLSAGALIFALCAVLPPRVGKWALCVILGAVTFYFEIQLVYNSIFGEFMPISQFGMGAGAVDMTADVVRTCAGLLKKPFSVKVSPQTVDQSAVALACQEAGAQCINISARFSGFDLDIDQARPVGPGAQGGWGGPYFIGYGLKNCALAANKLSIPIIAGLGVWDWRDIIKYTMVGASLVQSGVGIMLQGYDIAKKWTENISQWLDARGYSSLDEIRGIALPNILKTAQVERAPEGVYAKVDYDKCTKCGVCKRSCFYDAITLTKCGAVIDQHKCDGCGMCMEVCPANAVSMTSPQKRAQ